MNTSESRFSLRRTSLVGLSLLALSLVAIPALWASDQDVENEEVRQTRVIRVAGPGGRHVMAHGTGIMGNRGYLGVEAVELTPELREHFGAPSETGVMISRVADGSPAQNAGLQVGDILTTVDNESIGSFIDLFHEISDHEEGDVVRIEAWRNAQSLAFDATLTKMERPQVDIRRFRLGDEEGHHTVVLPEGDFEEVIELQARAFDEAIDRLNTEWPSEDWQERLHSYSTSREELLERLEALEERLRELEGDLAGPDSDEH